jgi:hypothetical protein
MEFGEPNSPPEPPPPPPSALEAHEEETAVPFIDEGAKLMANGGDRLLNMANVPTGGVAFQGGKAHAGNAHAGKAAGGASAGFDQSLATRSFGSAPTGARQAATVR